MAGAGKKWLIGCGIGCGVMLIILVGIGSCTYFGVKSIGNRVEELEASGEALSDLYGDVDDYAPPADGIITDERMEAFLQVRREVAWGENDLSRHLAVLDGRPDENGKKPGTIAKITSGVKFIPAIFEFAEERNRALLDQGMGIGEYAYIYLLGFYAFLDKDLRDGPSFSVMDDDDEHDDGVNWSYKSGDQDEEAIREKRKRELRDHLNDLGRDYLKNQLAALRDGEPLAAGLDAEAWGRQLDAEIDLLRDEPLRLPWEEGLPAHIAAALEIYRGDLEESYDDLVSPIDIGLTQED